MTFRASTHMTHGPASLAGEVTANVSARGRLPVATLGALGGSLTVVGAVAPWLSLYAGLEQLSGTSGLHGRIMIGLGLLAVGLSVAHLFRGSRATRWALGAAGFLVLGLGGWLGIGLIQTFSALAADPLLVASLEPGLGLAIAGGAATFATLFAPDERSGRTTSRRPKLSTLHISVASLVAVAGIIHVALTPEHLEGSALLGLGFLVAGGAQLTVAIVVLRARDTGAAFAALAVSAGSLVPLVAAVTVGLPVLPHGGAMGPLGPVEQLDDLVALTALVELIAIVASVRLLGRSRLGEDGRSAT